FADRLPVPGEAVRTKDVEEIYSMLGINEDPYKQSSMEIAMDILSALRAFKKRLSIINSALQKGVGEKEGEEVEIVRRKTEKTIDEAEGTLKKTSEITWGDVDDINESRECERVEVNAGGGWAGDEKWRLKEMLHQQIHMARFLKMVGSDPRADRIVRERLGLVVKWKGILTNLVRRAMAPTKIRKTWSRPNRRLPGVYPYKTPYGLGKVAVLVDTSGSVSDVLIKQVLGEVQKVARAAVADVVVIPWGATAYPEFELKSPADLGKLKLGGGGTSMLRDALEVVGKKYPDADAVVILSDWIIGDLEDPRVVSLLKRYNDRLVAVSVNGVSPPGYLKHRLKILMNEGGASYVIGVSFSSTA
ncbi:VWA-like domain-containing protein, partial [Thermogladius sp.]|uniref:VWA-like domain-containing protein n=1 Tax=Thermogladius sp. TaxID=2023064 RepID=UPI003D0B8826